jgi:subtilisin family serine protease
MIWNTVRRGIVALVLCAHTASAWAINNSVPAVAGNQSRTLLGDGTGVIIGVVDSGIDDTHPAFAGFDSLSNPRMVAEANFVTSEPLNTGDDLHGHGTRISSVALSSDPTFTGMAPDARFINARVLNATNGFLSDAQVLNGIGYAIDQGADVLNVSLNFTAPNSHGSMQMDLMIDWAVENRGVSCAICVGNISSGDGSTQVRSPGSAYNGVTAGFSINNFSRVNANSATAFTADNRMKPDVVAPGTDLTVANTNWEGAAPDWISPFGGCSYATPHVAGMMAQLLEAGGTHGLSTNPLVVKATMMNSASKILDRNGNAWEPFQSTTLSGVTTVAKPLDLDSGTGQINGLTLSTQYLAGEMAPGLVAPVGWDLNSIAGSQFIDYAISPNLLAGSKLSATLVWNRHVQRFDNGNGIIDAGDSFQLLTTPSNLDMQILLNGNLIAESVSTADNVEHLFWSVGQAGQYTLRVSGTAVVGGPETFAIAWLTTTVPEPAGWILAAIPALVLLVRRRRVGAAHRN